MILKTLIIIVVLTAVFTTIVALQPSTFRYSRSATIAASPDLVFAQINDLKNFQSWSPWAKLDPACVVTYSGPASGVDASFSWAGNKEVGEGSMTITESRPGELVRCRMDFKKPFAATHTAEFSLEPEGPDTVVTWSLFGSQNFIGKAVGLIINCDKMCGDQFNQGLANLNQLVTTTSQP